MRGAGDVVAPLGGVGDGVAHVLEAAAIHEVDDEFELVEDLEVGEFGLVAGLGEDLEACLDEGGGASAEDGLLAEEVGFGLLGEGGFEDAGAGGSRWPWRRRGPGRGRGRRRSCSTATRRGDAAAFGEDFADAVAGGLGGDEAHVDVSGRGDGTEADVEAVGEHEGLVLAVGCGLGEGGGDVGVVDRAGGLVGGEVHDDVGPLAGFGDREDFEAGELRALAARGLSGRRPTLHLDAGVLEVEGVGVALGAVADDGDLLGLDEGEVCVGVVVGLWPFWFLSGWGGWGTPSPLYLLRKVFRTVVC